MTTINNTKTRTDLQSQTTEGSQQRLRDERRQKLGEYREKKNKKITEKMDSGLKENVRRTLNAKTSDKENARPKSESRDPIPSRKIKMATTKPASHPANTGREDGQKDVGKKGASAEVGGTGAEGKRRPTLSHSFLAHKTIQQKKLITETAKQPQTLPSRPVLGTYKGKIVQSRVSSFRNTVAGVGDAENPCSDAKPRALRQGGPRPSCQPTVPQPPKAKSSTALSAKPTVASRPPVHSVRSATVGPAPRQNAVRVHRPSAANNPGGFSSAARARSNVGPVSQPQSNLVVKKQDPPPKDKPKDAAGASSTKGMKGVASSMSQYRAPKETHEERRARLAEWLAAKGKTLKRPSMVASVPHTVRQTTKKESALPPALNTTSDIKDSSVQGLPVVNTEEAVQDLCSALAAMPTPSSAETDIPEGVEGEKVEEDVKIEEEKKTVAQRGRSSQLQQTLKLESSSSEDEETDEEEDEKATGEASVVKYSVKTTPYLQSVKKKIQGEGSRSAIRDLKFLTPVRRSLRIQRQSSRLPSMLIDHDPCVTSLAELVGLDGDASAYIYRQNPSLQVVKDLPDQVERMDKV
ncbi:cytoskeleton-associated protein 2 [Lepisosteus oculatus]|uniref:cytoskeleton-associated protein 2 n=1 Tax=Lepisosteus oculatus TaxID=7918 RepID=UPI0007402E5F|nr:PREDICTED: cytoskeleton-associated protein 2 [Lepisosteus oculatus]